MSGAAHLRRQAELCLAMAELASNPIDAKRARLAAEHYLQRARSVEQEQGRPADPSSTIAESGSS